METYKRLIRTTLDKTDDLPLMGLYIVAYMGRVLYVGKSERGVASRLEQHHRSAGDTLGDWMHKAREDWHNVRLDVLEAPDNRPEYWLRRAEGQLVRRFRPLFNVALQ